MKFTKAVVVWALFGSLGCRHTSPISKPESGNGSQLRTSTVDFKKLLQKIEGPTGLDSQDEEILFGSARSQDQGESMKAMLVLSTGVQNKKISKAKFEKLVSELIEKGGGIKHVFYLQCYFLSLNLDVSKSEAFQKAEALTLIYTEKNKFSKNEREFLIEAFESRVLLDRLSVSYVILSKTNISSADRNWIDSRIQSQVVRSNSNMLAAWLFIKRLTDKL